MKMIRQSFLLLLVAMLATAPGSGFLLPTTQQSTTSRAFAQLLLLEAKKKKGKKGGKGFGKAPPAPAAPKKVVEDPSPFISAQSTDTQPSSLLQSIETGGSSSIPTMEVSSSEPELAPEERAKKLLREQYGLRTAEEQKMEDQIQEQRKRLQDLKAMAEKDEDIDIMAMLPAPLLKGIDTFLKLGVAVCTVLFVTAGLGITLEAWSKTSGNELPTNIDTFIVDVVEPNFTTGLLVLLGFSVSLGGFAALQLSSSAAQYKEK